MSVDLKIHRNAVVTALESLAADQREFHNMIRAYRAGRAEAFAEDYEDDGNQVMADTLREIALSWAGAKP